MSNKSDATIEKRKLPPGLSRRPHTKSRTGCHTCKARRIKCSEERPICQNCINRNLDCSYPSSTIPAPERAIVKTQPRLLPQPLLFTHPSTVTFTDLRLFHHFLMVAYPYLPAGNDKIWTMEIPKIAEHHEYLMHAMLGLAASHLHRVSPQPQYQASAVAHRGHAIAGLNKAITAPNPSRHEADAMLATAYSLTFQAQYMEDGLMDFVTMVRGCALITKKIQASQVLTSFDLEPDAHVSTLEPGVSHMPTIDKDILTTGLQSLSRLSPILQTETDLRFFFSIKRTMVASLTSTRAGFIEFAAIYSVWFTASSSSFKELIDPTNKAAQVLLAYSTTLGLLMSPVTQPMYRPPRRTADTKNEVLLVAVSWVRKLFKSLPENMKKYIAWPEAVVEQVEREVIEGQDGNGGVLIASPSDSEESKDSNPG